MILNYAANIISANFKQENFLNAQVQRKNLSLYSNLVGNLNGVDVQESMKEAPWPLPPFLLITVETEFDEQFNMSDTLLMQLMYSIRTLFKKIRNKQHDSALEQHHTLHRPLQQPGCQPQYFIHDKGQGQQPV